MGAVLFVLVAAALLAIIPASIARAKGRSYLGWWIFGFLLFIVALPAAIIAPRNRKGLEKEALAHGDKKCPFCAELIKKEAVVCRYCQREQPAFAA